MHRRHICQEGLQRQLELLGLVPVEPVVLIRGQDVDDYAEAVRDSAQRQLVTPAAALQIMGQLMTSSPH